MLRREEVAELAAAEGLGEHAADLLERVRPGWRLELDRGGSAAPGIAAKIGGHPDLAEHESWPWNRRGVPMTFLAQVDSSRLPAFDDGWSDPHQWGHGGRLIRIFADLLDNPVEPGPAVVLACDPGASLTRTHAPPVPDPWPPGGPADEFDLSERFHVLPEAAAHPQPFLSAPETHPVLKPELFDFSPTAERYTNWAARLRVDGAEIDEEDELEPGTRRATEPDPYSIHHLLGEASSIQEDVRGTGAMVYDDPYWAAEAGVEPAPGLATADAWRVLLALHYDHRLGLDIQDGGAFHVLAPVADLAIGRYDRTLCSIDSC